MEKFLPYTRQMIEDADVSAVVDVLRGDYLTTGPAVTAFEDALATRIGARSVVACSSGTAALHLTALALGLTDHDSVIAPALTFAATANGPRYTGAKIVFADVDPETGLMRPSDFEAAIERAGPSLRAVYPVHLGGQACDMPTISAIARERGVAVIEDAAHALGTVNPGPDGQPVGACEFSDMTVFSFHPAKTITMGEGGAITTQDPELAKRLRLFCTHGITRDAGDFVDGPEQGPWYCEQQDLGYNYRVSDIHCVIGLAQLGRLDSLVEKRLNLRAAYNVALAKFEPVLRPVRQVADARIGWHLYQVLIDFDNAGIKRETLMTALRDRGIGTQVHYIPVHHHPYYRSAQQTPELKGADAFYRQCLSLPFFAGMDESDIARVADAFADILQ